jgi:hypothetical protein
MQEVETIQRGLAHRPFNYGSESHLKFEQKLAEKIANLISKYPLFKFQS